MRAAGGKIINQRDVQSNHPPIGRDVHAWPTPGLKDGAAFAALLRLAACCDSRVTRRGRFRSLAPFRSRPARAAACKGQRQRSGSCQAGGGPLVHAGRCFPAVAEHAGSPPVSTIAMRAGVGQAHSWAWTWGRLASHAWLLDLDSLHWTASAAAGPGHAAIDCLLADGLLAAQLMGWHLATAVCWQAPKVAAVVGWGAGWCDAARAVCAVQSSHNRSYMPLTSHHHPHAHSRCPHCKTKNSRPAVAYVPVPCSSPLNQQTPCLRPKRHHAAHLQSTVRSA